MQNVSQAYKDSMKSLLRERGFIKLSFGLVNQEAQKNASADASNTTYFSNDDSLFTTESEYINTYATLEDDFTKVDGTMLFLPRNKESSIYLDTGIVSEHTWDKSPSFTLTINLNILATDIKGLTVDFGDNYPTHFTVKVNDSESYEFVNDKSTFVTEQVFEDVTKLELVISDLKNSRGRCRVRSLLFGYGLKYYNDSVVSSSLDRYVSPIGADVPQIDFSVQIKNYDKYFDVDNPASAINFFETGQVMTVHYGYQTPGLNKIEWVKGDTLLCSDWEADDTTATIRCQDVFRNMDAEYYKGVYASNLKSYGELAEEILSDAGITDYEIAPSLYGLYTRNPIPRVSHKEALQIIANACRCVLSQTRDGVIEIKSSKNPTENVIDFTMTRNDMTSSPKVIKQELVREIIVPIYSYQSNTQEESFFSGDVTVTDGETLTFFTNDASYGYKIVSSASSSNMTIVNEGSYFVDVLFRTAGTYTIEIFARRYKIIESYHKKTLNTRGKTVKWENPLISTVMMARDLAEWLGEYYSSNVEYEYDTRGNPELDVNDIIYQENDFHDGMMVNVYRQSLSFNQSFSGHVTARRIGGETNALGNT